VRNSFAEKKVQSPFASQVESTADLQVMRPSVSALWLCATALRCCRVCACAVRLLRAAYALRGPPQARDNVSWTPDYLLAAKLRAAVTPARADTELC
jgi:hypothetical protein